jgi:hypothetical protein
MRTTNLPAGSQRTSNVGLVWKEVLTGAAGTVLVQQQGTVRVSCVTACTVTIDGMLSMTMQAGEVEYFNVGAGQASNITRQSELVIAGGTANVQVALDVERGRRTP